MVGSAVVGEQIAMVGLAIALVALVTPLINTCQIWPNCSCFSVSSLQNLSSPTSFLFLSFFLLLLFAYVVAAIVGMPCKN
jgi:succinate dehydrogenase hydrophobic anchor subunit